MRRFQGIRSGIRIQGGYTLIELMFAIVIIAISVLALYQMFITGSGLLTEEYHRRAALEKASGHMEEMKYYEVTLDSVPRNKSGTYSEVLISGDDGQEPIEALYTLVIEHSAEHSQAMPLYSEVTLVYTWTEWSGVEQEIKLRGKF